MYFCKTIKSIYKQTILGVGWALLRPVVTMIVFTVIFGKLAKVPSDGIPYPIFTYAALLPWNYFATVLSKSSQSLICNASMLTKIYFPRILMPFISVFTGLLDFVLAFSVFIIMMIWYGIVPQLQILFIFPLFILMIITGSGIGLWFSALGIYYRDVRYAINFLSKILMYVAPVVWPVSLIPSKYRLLYGLYPMGGIIEGFRSALIGKNPMPWDLIFVGTISAIIIFITGMFIFRRMEKIFADVA